MRSSIAAWFLVFALFFEGGALAVDGEIIFRDSLYGAVVGGIVGLGTYAMSGSDAGAHIGGGVVAGTLIGAVVGVMESSGAVDIRQGTISIGVPTPMVTLNGDETTIRADLLKTHF